MKHCFIKELVNPKMKISPFNLLLCCTEEIKSCSFGITWVWVNDDRIFIFRWAILLKAGFKKMITWDWVQCEKPKRDSIWKGEFLGCNTVRHLCFLNFEWWVIKTGHVYLIKHSSTYDSYWGLSADKNIWSGHKPVVLPQPSAFLMAI